MVQKRTLSGIRRPRSAYTIFYDENIEALKDQYPGLKYQKLTKRWEQPDKP
jgi:hypothetical protein